MKKLLFLLLVGCLSSFKQNNFSSSSGDEVRTAVQNYLKREGSFSNNPFDFDSLWKNRSFDSLLVSEPLWLIPSSVLPQDVIAQNSNNNVCIAFYNKKIYVAFRTGPTHFASKETGIYIISSIDLINWKKEMEFFGGSDVREPFLIEINNKLHFYFFEAGQKMTAFEPKFISHYILDSSSDVWQKQQDVLEKGEVHWSLKSRFGKVFLSSYAGSHYQLKGESKVSLYFKITTDGHHFNAVKGDSLVYFGGVSECDFEFDVDSNLWAVTRLEDGDKTGFGSHVVFASKDSIDKWQFPDKADKNCYMSPKLFRQGDDIFLVARRQLGNHPFGRADEKKSMRMQRLINWISFSLSAKTTSLYKIDKQNKSIKWVADLPGAGDTAFPSIWRIDEQTVLVANYSSPLKNKNRTWLRGQLGKTGIYFVLIRFK